MRYVVSRSQNPKEINRYFVSEEVPRIGRTFAHGGRVFRVLDIEWVEREDSGQREVRGRVARLM
jgi:hypothetical protein